MALDTMIEGVRYLVNTVGLSLSEALCMASLNPATAINREQDLGSISVGKVANLVFFDDKLTVLNTLVNGQFTHLPDWLRQSADK